MSETDKKKKYQISISKNVFEEIFDNNYSNTIKIEGNANNDKADNEEIENLKKEFRNFIVENKEDTKDMKKSEKLDTIINSICDNIKIKDELKNYVELFGNQTKNKYSSRDIETQKNIIEEINSSIDICAKIFNDENNIQNDLGNLNNNTISSNTSNNAKESSLNINKNEENKNEENNEDNSSNEEEEEYNNKSEILNKEDNKKKKKKSKKKKKESKIKISNEFIRNLCLGKIK